MAGYSVTFTVVDQATKQLDTINRRIAAMRAPIERMSKSTAKFIDVSGLRKVADGFNWIARGASMALRSLSAMVPVLGAITSATTIAGMVKLVSSFAEWGSQLQSNADQIGISTDELQKWQDATTRAGGNADDMTNALKALRTTMGDAVTGKNAQALAMFKQFGIDIQDANGNMRKTTDVMRDVFKVLDGLPSEYDRSKVSGLLLNDSQQKLYETYKQSGKSLDDYLSAEDNHLHLTQQQLESLHKYQMAMGSLNTSFKDLGEQIAATLADDLTPLIKALDEWVLQHQPDIIAAVKDVSDAFEGWLKNVDWDAIKQDLNDAMGILKEIKTVADAVADAINKTMFLFGQGQRQFTKEDVFTNSPWYSNLSVEQKKQVRDKLGISDDQAQAAAHPKYNVQPFSYANPGSWMNRAPAGVDPYTGKKFGEPGAFPPGGPSAISTPSGSGGAGAQGAAPKGPVEQAAPGDMSQPRGIRNMNPGNINYIGQPGAKLEAGQHARFAAFGTMQEGVSALVKQLQTNQDQHGITTLRGQINRWAPSSENDTSGYIANVAKQTGLDPDAKLDTHDPETAKKLVNAITWVENSRKLNQDVVAQGVAMGFGQQQTQVAAAPTAAPGAAPVTLAQAGPVAPPAAAPPTNGTVNVDITHRNAPPDATVTARGSGAVNVAPPRIEHPQLDFASA